MSEPTTPENENAGQTLAPVSLFCGCSEFREAQQSCTDNETKIKFCNAWHALARHYTVCKECQIYLLDGDGDLCAIGKHLLAEKMYMAECRLEIKS